MRIQKAVITAAGLGTRFLPATKAQSKEMLTLVDRPLIQHAVEELVASGIEQITIITRPGQQGIQEHFAASPELEAVLESRNNSELLERVQKVSRLADISYVHQQQQLGLGHAVLMAKNFVGNEPFALILPDDIILSEVPVIRQLIDIAERYNGSVIAVEEVPEDKISSYGIIKPQTIDESVYRVLELVEKPDPKLAPSNLGIVGRYVLVPEIFPILEHTAPSKGSEIQLTDGLHKLLEQQAIYASQFKGVRYDTGTPLGLIKASVAFTLNDPDIGQEFRNYLRDLKL